jgi:tetratricopeptide (TPR) repeat protein
MRYGLLLSLGIFVLGIAGAALSWYPSRIGGPAYWLDDHLYAPALATLTTGVGWPANAGLLYAVGLLCAFAGYLGGAVWAARLRMAGHRELVLVGGVQALLCGWLCLQPYLSSQDIFSYAFYAHILTWYHANPYVAVPRDFPYDPLFGAIFWKDQPSNYGPVWTYLSALVSLLASGGSGTTIAALRVVAALAGLAGTPIIWSFARRLNPATPLVATILWAWNPLLLVESAGAGHNDVVMALFIIASLATWFHRRRSWSVAFLVLAFLTKYVAAILLPLYLVLWLKDEPARRVSIVARTVVIGAGLTVLAFAPVYAGPATLSVVGFGANPLAYINSPLELAYRDLRIALGEPSELVNLPVHYLGFWVNGAASIVMWDKPNTTHSTGVALPAGEPILVVEPPSGEWLHVYEPRTGRFGFLQSSEVQRTSTPRLMPADPSTEQVIVGAEHDPRAQKTNVVLRLLSAVTFATVYVYFLRRLARGEGLVRAGLAVLLVYLMVVQSWFWPWYLIWALPFAVFASQTMGGRALLALTATASVLNVQPAISVPPTLDWLLQARMLAIDGGPFLGVAVAYFGAREASWLRARLRRLRSPAVRQRVTLAARHRLMLAIGTAAIVAVLAEVLLAQWSGATRDRPLVIPWEQAYVRAEELFAAGNYAGAAQAASDVLRAQPQETSALQLRVSANLAMQRYADVVPDLTKLLADDPTNVELLLERANTFDRIDREDRARADYEQVVALAPANPSGYVGIGTVDFHNADFEGAALWLSRALQLDPGRPDATRQLAAVLAASGQTRGALVLYDQAVRQNPLDAETYAERAAVLSASGPTRRVASDLRHVLVLSGDVQVNQWASQHLSVVDPATTSGKIQS